MTSTDNTNNDGNGSVVEESHEEEAANKFALNSLDCWSVNYTASRENTVRMTEREETHENATARPGNTSKIQPNDVTNMKNNWNHIKNNLNQFSVIHWANQ